MTTCHLHASGLVELYFYRELDAAEQARMDRHVPVCTECARALDDLQTIRLALSARPDVAAPAGSDWGPFMARLDEAVRREQLGSAPAEPMASAFKSSSVASAFRRKIGVRRSYVGYVAMAALITLVTISVFFAWRTHDRTVELRRASASGAPGFPAATIGTPANVQAQADDRAFIALSEQHFERSKLVVLGLATKDPADAVAADWKYERELAGTLLNDTRLYRLAAEERGLSSLARVMQDLELVLLQASMSDKPDAASLEQLQRLIRKRDLVTKIELVTTTAGI